MKTMMALAALLAASFAPHAVAAPGWQLGLGVEDYAWQETIPGVTIRPKEHGSRLALHIGYQSAGDAGKPYFIYAGKVYQGAVNYDTATMVTLIPVTTTTNYSGMSNEAKVAIPRGGLRFIAGLGYDFWLRAISNGRTATGLTVLGYTERYDIVFVRLGLEGNLSDTLTLGGGIKHTIMNRQEAVIAGQTSVLYPGTSLSPYLDVGIRLGQRLTLAAYYDSWRFTQSPPNALGFYQPESSMDTLGIRASWQL